MLGYATSFATGGATGGKSATTSTPSREEIAARRLAALGNAGSAYNNAAASGSGNGNGMV